MEARRKPGSRRRLRDPQEPLSYDWLRANGWHVLERLERQPTDSCRRCVGLETVDDPRMMVAAEDLCIDLMPERWPDPGFWFCFITRASAQNRHASVWLHVRHLKTVADLVLLYEGLTGRQFGPPSWRRDELAPPVLDSQGSEVEASD